MKIITLRNKQIFAAKAIHNPEIHKLKDESDISLKISVTDEIVKEFGTYNSPQEK